MFHKAFKPVFDYFATGNTESPKDLGEPILTLESHESRVLVALREPISYAPAVYARSACGKCTFSGIDRFEVEAQDKP
jgi:hypothetical protein